MLVFIVVLAVLANLCSADFVTMLQNDNKVGKLSLVSSVDGSILKQSEPTATFTWPYVEMTTDTTNKKIYSVVFPDDSNSSVLYQHNADLSLEYTWPDTSFWFFDLQFAPTQNTLYGIKVTSTYGRTLSRFTAVPGEKTVSAEELFTLPYMWYVNASSYHAQANKYFALCNYFPGKPESTLAQKLTVCDFSFGADCQVLDIDASAGILQFISYSQKTSSLYFASMQDGVAKVGTIDPLTGKITSILFSKTAKSLGPLVAEEDIESLAVFFRFSSWELWHVPYKTTAVNGMRVHTYSPTTDFASFSAASRLQE
ncbi:hypothetical protein EON65_34865 [archaeon]|nr:MAG: hypothetical protein EON65_34865 [archaeon]